MTTTTNNNDAVYNVTDIMLSPSHWTEFKKKLIMLYSLPAI